MMGALRNKPSLNTRRGNSSSKKMSKGFQSIRYLFLAMLAFIIYCIIATLHLEPDLSNNNEHLKLIRVNADKSKQADPPTSTNNQHGEKPDKPKATIAYAISLTDCGKNEVKSYVEGAAVLRQSIHLSSYESFEVSGSHYSYHLFAFVHPEAEKCSGPLKTLGYDVMIKDIPLDTSAIKGEFLKEHVVRSGCCGAKEFLKLYAYTLTDYPVAVHLDMDALILKPFDVLYDAMIEGSEDQKTKIQQLSHNKELKIPQQIDAFFTRDYNMINPGKKNVGAQGGFLIFRPSMDAFNENVEVILEGDFQRGRGWGGTHGGFFGAQQIQGLTPYFYDILHPNTAVELNRCYFNSMNDNPKQKMKRTGEEKCRTGETTCEDCRKTNFDDIYSVHFTICQKPWECHIELMHLNTQRDEKKLCHHFHKSWFTIRKDLEHSYLPTIISNYKSVALDTPDEAMNKFSQGFCNGGGFVDYVTMNFYM